MHGGFYLFAHYPQAKLYHLARPINSTEIHIVCQGLQPNEDKNIDVVSDRMRLPKGLSLCPRCHAKT